MDTKPKVVVYHNFFCGYSHHFIFLSLEYLKKIYIFPSRAYAHFSCNLYTRISNFSIYYHNQVIFLRFC